MSLVGFKLMKEQKDERTIGKEAVSFDTKS